MKNRHVANVIAGASAMAFAMAGCSSSEEIKPTAPDGTVEQVTHNLGYADILGKMTLHQTIRLDVDKREKLNLYNYTTSPVDSKRLKKLVNFYTQLGKSGLAAQPKIVVLHPFSSTTHKPINASVKTDVMPRGLKEYDIVLVPNETKLPTSFTADDQYAEPDAVTRYYDTVSQAVSVVKQPLDPELFTPTKFLAAAGLPTELCQGTIDTLALGTVQGSDGRDDLLGTERLVQETICNGYGAAFEAIAQGDDYDIYQAIQPSNIGLIEIAGKGNFEVEAYNVPAAEYSVMQRVMTK